MARILVANVITFFSHFVVTIFVCAVFIENVPDGRMPIAYYLYGAMMQFLFAISARLGYRYFLILKKRNQIDVKICKHILIYGAGDAGKTIAREIMNTPKLNERVVAFIDDDNNKWGGYISGVPVRGGREDLFRVVKQYKIEKIYVAIPSISNSQRKEILNLCAATECELLNLPSTYQISTKEITVSKMKEVSIEDLLGRDTIKVNNEEIGRFLEGKVVLITGAGGSIGSELSRQVAANNPKKLVLFDIYENGVYDVQLELRKKYPNLDLIVLIGSVRDTRRIFQVFEEYRPQIVYHAAAHKHVPLMEDSPCESIKNNSIGTYKTAFAAMLYGTERFVLISTDKAVNPTNIMGASKRLCEMVIQTFDAKIKAGKAYTLPLLFTHWLEDDLSEQSMVDILGSVKTEFVAVRFGNVLGSNGSVIPIFKRQIDEGGPVTVTHPDIIRYFMTIPEAVSLVLQAGTYAHGGEIFVLDMGEPMKIDTLARNLIRLSGYVPDEDIKIEYTGLRPGEKLYEEKLMDEEGMEKTDNNLIHIGKPLEFDHDVFLENLDELNRVAYKNTEEIKAYVAKFVQTYHPN
ncbi:MAG: polysaccharide biosynthesis protein [Clostridia bacterium]|nr:polysaccharide biosynthesis protein [Clostridia bacterium]